MGPQPSPPRSRGCFHTVSNFAIVLILGASSTRAQTGPRIEHDGLRCVLSGEHLVLEAVVGPANVQCFREPNGTLLVIAVSTTVGI